MTKIIWATLVALFCYLGSANAAVQVVATYGWIGDLVQQIGQDRVSVSVLAQPSFDPHFVPPKPSLAVKLRNADLLVINGGQLEIGWLPPVLRQAANARIQPNSEGFLDLSSFVTLSNPRPHATRADGDVHPDGNPHYVFNPDNMSALAYGVAHRLCQLDKASCGFYEQSLARFDERWQAAKIRWQAKLAPLKGQHLVQYHESFDDLAHWLGMTVVANIEPVPGVPPSASHLEKLLKRLADQQVAMIVQEHFRDKEATEWLAKQRQVKWQVLPSDVGATEKSKDLFSWFDEIVDRLAP
ncbi:MAG: zinc ABC transporter substrate-binding protein [Gammaproteobacteria bacterium]|nr:zinc ABC transporter substrate-binding protein [Gammaproteobacteria bacterium]